MFQTQNKFREQQQISIRVDTPVWSQCLGAGQSQQMWQVPIDFRKEYRPLNIIRFWLSCVCFGNTYMLYEMQFIHSPI